MLLLLQKKTENVKEEGMPLTQLGFLLLKYLDQSNQGGKGLFHPTALRSQFIVKLSREGTQGWDLVAGTGAEVMEECSLLVVPHGMLVFCLIASRTINPAVTLSIKCCPPR